MTTIRFTNEVVVTENEKDAIKVLRRQHVGATEVTKNGEVWTVAKEFAAPTQPKDKYLDPDARRRRMWHQ